MDTAHVLVDEATTRQALYTAATREWHANHLYVTTSGTLADIGVHLRFSEQMPLDAQHAWRREEMVTAEEILRQLGDTFLLGPVDGRGSAPAEPWYVNGTEQTVGVIGSVTRPFCGACDRLRLTADGQLRTCLFARTETDLRGPLRAGATDRDLAQLMLAAVLGKQPGHGIDDPTFLQPPRPMSAIGG